MGFLRFPALRIVPKECSLSLDAAEFNLQPCAFAKASAFAMATAPVPPNARSMLRRDYQTSRELKPVENVRDPD